MNTTPENGLLKINLGSGHWKLEGWVNVDIDPDSEPDVLADLSEPLPFEDGVAAFMHTEDFIDRVQLMVQNSQFKRRLPVIAKVSNRTIDRDFRYARDWGR